MISQTRNCILALLLLAATAPATSPPANAVPDAGAAPATPASGAVAPNATTPNASVQGKLGAAAADDSDAPLKPGESYQLLGFSLSGSKHIDADALIATLPQHKGDPISAAQIKADTDTIEKALTARHVHFAEITTALLERQGPGHYIYVLWDIQHEDAFGRARLQGFWTFGGQSFSGNKALTNEQLEKAIDLKVGERVREGAISDARTGMEQAYDKVFPGQTVKIACKLTLRVKPMRMATFAWTVTEPPARPAGSKLATGNNIKTGKP